MATNAANFYSETEELEGDVAVIGAGIAGMQAALDIANAGFKVFLIESSPTIGGNMARLDKTFPTGDCAMCTISPRMIGVLRHKNITLLVNSYVKSCSKEGGSSGSFNLRVVKKARYVDEQLCNGCGMCAEACPVVVKNEFDIGIGSRKAIYIPFPQAAPLIYTIDKEHCIDCSFCEIACEANAIKKNDSEKEIDIKVNAIVVATGFEQFDASEIKEYGFGRYKNVITNLQFERMLSSSGPLAGKIIRPSDGKKVKNIAFIQCVGSRDLRRFAYCSRICCMASTKEAIVALETDPELKPAIFYIDLRAFGKGYNEYVEKAKKHGIRYIRGRVSKIYENKENNLVLHHENTELGKRESEEFELVVLASALKPSSKAKELAKILGIEVDEYGFIKTKMEAPYETSEHGIFVAGTAREPMDIPDAISFASAAASAAIDYITRIKTEKEEKEEKAEIEEIEKEERVHKHEEPRVGVFVCHCGKNIASVVNVEEVANFAKSLDNVAYAKNVLYACSSMNLAELKEAIKKHDLNRIVVASCSPRMHEETFRNACKEAGLNPYLFEMANIREHCSWVHAFDKKAATEKAKDLVAMAVAKARLLTPEKEGKVRAERSVLVIGAGASGLASAIACAEAGLQTYVVEKEGEAGGWLRKAYAVESNSEIFSADEILNHLIKRAKENERIRIIKNAELKSLQGYAGNFEAVIGYEKDGAEEIIKAGAIILAIGSREKIPEGIYAKRKSNRIITLNELEEMLKSGKKRFGRVAFIQCFEARDENYKACSRTCCMQAIKLARVLRKLSDENKVIIIYRDLMAFGNFELAYPKSQEEGIRYIRYSPDKISIEENGESIRIKLYDTLIKKNIIAGFDYVVLSTPQIPCEDSEKIKKILRLPTNELGFFMESHMKLKPVEFTTNGIFLAGACHSPKELSLAIAQAYAAAGKAIALLRKGEIETKAIVSEVNKALCIGCGRCYSICPFSAIELVEDEHGNIKSNINQAICMGCGLCISVCPNGAINLKYFKREQILAQIEAALA